MKKLFHFPFAMLLCMAMSVMFTACEPENIDKDDKAIAFLCDGKAIADGSTYTTSKLDTVFAALGMTRFAPDIDLVGQKDGKVVVTVKSLNEAMVEICAFGGCQITLPYLNYTATAEGDITADTVLPLDIHYTPTDDCKTHRAEALITAYYEGYETEAVSFKLVMTNAKEE